VRAQVWQREGVTDDNKLTSTWDELKVYPIPAAIYLIKNLMQYVIFLYVDAPSYQILKNLNIISTGILYRVFLKKKLSSVQWSALILLALGCTIAQTTSQSEKVRAVRPSPPSSAPALVVWPFSSSPLSAFAVPRSAVLDAF